MVYSVKANAYDSVHNWFITEEILIREQNGIQNLKILFTDIKRLRVYYNPMRCMANNYECEILTVRNQKYKIRSSSFESFANFASQAETYVPFIRHLLATVINKNRNAEIIAGLSKKGFIISYATSFLIIVLMGILLEPITGALLAGLMMFGYVIYFIRGFKKNWPRNIVNNNIPDKVLPIG